MPVKVLFCDTLSFRIEGTTFEVWQRLTAQQFVGEFSLLLVNFWSLTPSERLKLIILNVHLEVGNHWLQISLQLPPFPWLTQGWIGGSSKRNRFAAVGQCITATSKAARTFYEV